MVGCIVAGIGDLTFDLYGYAYALLSCLCQVKRGGGGEGGQGEGEEGEGKGGEGHEGGAGLLLDSVPLSCLCQVKREGRGTRRERGFC